MQIGIFQHIINVNLYDKIIIKIKLIGKTKRYKEKLNNEYDIVYINLFINYIPASKEF